MKYIIGLILIAVLATGVGEYFYYHVHPSQTELTQALPQNLVLATTTATSTQSTTKKSRATTNTQTKTSTTTVPITQTNSTTPQDICAALPRSGITNTTGITGGPIISFDFDDGFISSYTNALPIINSAGFPTTQYIITSFLTKSGRVNLQQVLAMRAAGNEIGAHTRTHPYLAQISPEQAINEICGSRQDLLADGILTTTLAYPEGSFNQSIEDIVQRAGFIGARTTEAGLNNATTNHFVLRSYQMGSNTTFPQIKFMIDQAITDKEWLTIVFHRTDETGNAISVPSSLIQQVVQYVKSTGVPVVTESQGLGIMNSITNTINDLNPYTPGT